MRILIVEDEILLAKHLSKLVRDVAPASTIEAVTNSVSSTVEWLQQHPTPDLIFLDIELADGQSFEIFEHCEVRSPIIFTTAYDEYALKAFGVNSVDYLLKPIREADLRKAIAKLSNLQHGIQHASIDRLLQQLHGGKQSAYRERLLVKQGQKMLSIETNQVGIFFTHNTVNYLITKAGQKYIVNLTLDELEQSLDPKTFYRMNRQYILAHGVITVVHPWFNGKLKVETSIALEEPIIVSRDKAPLFRAWMGE